MNKNDNNSWSKLAGMILGKITAVWFALMVAALLLVAPTKTIIWVVNWFWNLF